MVEPQKEAAHALNHGVERLCQPVVTGREMILDCILPIIHTGVCVYYNILAYPNW